MPSPCDPIRCRKFSIPEPAAVTGDPRVTGPCLPDPAAFPVNRTQLIKTASLVAVAGNALLAVSKIGLGWWAGSLAVMADGFDTASDILTSLITYFSALLILHPPTVKYPYGFRRVESVAAKLLAFVIFFAGAQLAINTVGLLVENTPRAPPSMLAVVITVVSIGVKFLLARYQFRIGRLTQSSMLVANGRNMQNDMLISLAVLVGLGFTFGLGMPVLDVVTAFLVSIWIIKVAFEIYLDASVELMDGGADPELYPRIIACVEDVPGAHNPHRIRLNKLGNLYVVTLDLEVDARLSVGEAHRIARRVEKAISENIENIYDIVIHIEPLDNFEPDEVYGVSRAELPE